MRAQFVVSEIGIGLRRNFTMTIAVIVTVTVSMFFLGAAVLLSSQVSLSRAFWYDEIELSLFLCGENSPGASCASGEITGPQREGLLADLQRNPEIAKITYESKQQAFERFKEQFKGSALVETVTPQVLPESFQIKLKNPERYDIVASQYQGAPGVENLQDYRKVLRPLFGFLRFLLFGAYVFAGIMLVSAALLIFNTIRLAAFSRRRETGIMRLVGASSFYIQLPFILEGIIAASIGIGAAFGLLWAVYHWGKPWLEERIQITPYVSTGSLVEALVVMIVVGVSIAALASWLTLRRYLRV